ncbi:uncharacterized protein LOC108223838 [Daucus carota subsp. sativus]|uniref:uncharacterized protein LOC108223838 n=1 Tax=Daucus carota subsp. sativus TaxID=79200 RepID=UPI0007EF44B3|nr:PREDICTED: uncharacterized PE-PGRS family protein PE_PGRS3-like [Daucus carota subsp. sativus]
MATGKSMTVPITLALIALQRQTAASKSKRPSMILQHGIFGGLPISGPIVLPSMSPQTPSLRTSLGHAFLLSCLGTAGDPGCIGGNGNGKAGGDCRYGIGVTGKSGAGSVGVSGKEGGGRRIYGAGFAGGLGKEGGVRGKNGGKLSVGVSGDEGGAKGKNGGMLSVGGVTGKIGGILSVGGDTGKIGGMLSVGGVTGKIGGTCSEGVLGKKGGIRGKTGGT